MTDFISIAETIIGEKIEKLSSLYHHKGVQPHEIIQQCIETQYRHYELSKTNEVIVFEVKFLEDESKPLSQLCTMRYIYNTEMFLQVIAEIIDGQEVVCWERQDKIDCVKTDLTHLVKTFHSKSKVKELHQFFDSLPNPETKPEFSLVAV